MLADLRGLTRNEHRTFFHIQHKSHVHKLPRPEVPVGIRNRRPQVDRSRSVLHGVVQKLYFSRPRRVFRIPRQPHQRLQHPAAHPLLYFGEIPLGDRKRRVDGIDSLDGKKRRGVGLHNIPYVHQARPGAAIDR